MVMVQWRKHWIPSLPIPSIGGENIALVIYGPNTTYSHCDVVCTQIRSQMRNAFLNKGGKGMGRGILKW